MNSLPNLDGVTIAGLTPVAPVSKRRHSRMAAPSADSQTERVRADRVGEDDD
jgi:hypothetical protein